MSDRSAIVHIFVYGTLKRGQVRERCWPRPPLSVDPAWTMGRLYDLGPHPAMTEGDDRVLGELWRFAAGDLPETLRVLDGIEGFRNRPDDWYVRVVTSCTTESRDIVLAFAYRYARPQQLLQSRRMAPDDGGYCVWFGQGIQDLHE